jgi:drug/metabolite transporter superfamily protein YnfA
MVTLIKILGVAMMLVAVMYLSKPDFMKSVMQFFRQGWRMYFAAAIRLVLAVIFLLAAGQCRHPRIVAAFGIIFLISAVIIFIISAEKTRAVLDGLIRQPPFVLRIIALVPLAVGALLLYAA